MDEAIRQRITRIEERSRFALRLVQDRRADRVRYLERHVEQTRALLPNLLHHAAQLPILGLTMLAPYRRTVRRIEDDGQRPLLFVHGMNGGRGNFLPMRLFFRAAGRRRNYAIQFDESAGIEGMARQFIEFVEQIITVNHLGPAQQLDVVAHSLGGLVVRAALCERAELRTRLHTIVTMGTPHGGTLLAKIYPLRIARELHPKAPIFAKLDAQTPWPGAPSYPRLISLWSRNDLILVPQTNARLAGAENIELSDYTHYDFLLDGANWNRVFDLVRES
ncbi:MAG: alpha/beta fold hydrolase [Myxococcales bacterium]|nr:alpha/beta fold hydrolase [Myxococcales bacterium]